MKHIKSFFLFESLNITGPLYHGNRKGDFPPKRKRFANSIFLTSDIGFAKNFAGFDEREEFPEGAVWEVQLRNNLNLCNPTDEDTMKELDLKSVIQKMIDENYVDSTNGKKFTGNRGKGFKGFDYDKGEEFDLEDTSQAVYNYLWLIKNGVWQIIECEPIIEKIRDFGYGGFVVEERGAKNIAIFKEDSILDFKKLEF
jgi:hypothetical protein